MILATTDVLLKRPQLGFIVCMMSGGILVHNNYSKKYYNRQYTMNIVKTLKSKLQITQICSNHFCSNNYFSDKKWKRQEDKLTPCRRGEGGIFIVNGVYLSTLVFLCTFCFNGSQG